MSPEPSEASSSTFLPRRSFAPWEPLAWAIAYLLVGTVVYRLQGSIGPTLWYPPVVIGAAALLTFGWRALPFVFVCDFLVTYSITPTPLTAPALSALGTALECATAFALLSRAGVNQAMARARDVPLALLLAGCVAPAVGATVGLLVASFSDIPLRESNPLQFWLTWWLCDTTSMIVLLPALLLWLAPPDDRRTKLAPGRGIERVALVVAVLLLGAAGFVAPTLGEVRLRLPWLGLGVSLVMWAAARFSRRTTASVVAFLACIAIMVVRGEFLLQALPSGQIVALLHTVQLDVALLSMGGLALNSLIARERRARQELEWASRALSLSASRSSLASRAGRIGTFEIDPEKGTIWSDELYELLGYAPQSFVPSVRPRCYVFDTDTDDMLDRRWSEHIASGERVEMEVAFKAADGRRLWCEIRAEPVEREGRRLFAGTVADVTQRRALEQQFLQSQKMEVVGRLAGGVAHDFNNVLTAILGFTELAGMHVGEGSPARGNLAQIRQAALRAAALTQRLLAFSRMQPQEPRAVEVDALVRRLEPMLQRLIGESVSLRLALGAPRACVLADPTQLEQVLMNLVVNARDAMPLGGRLEIASHVAPRLDGSGEVVRVRVSDTGTGIDAETRERIFEPFFTTKAPGQGTGLGLSTVLGIVRQSGGVITVESTPGAGSVFSVDLPLHGLPGAPAAEEAVEHGPGGDEHVLLVEDDALVRDYVLACLEQAGYRVASAEHGSQALEKLAAGSVPSLLLTDVNMPGMSGIELARRVHAAHPAVPVLFMTGYIRSFEPGGEAAEFAGQAMAKPFTRGELLQRIRAVLDSRRSRKHP
ncbi:MAG: response regulator [Candidatus Eisenbacteria bacterium]|uniref:histidine kinase n=1 Tax=Eiseniibacteriota bacterium TaxID=2212470 RepID=A0A933SA88_UNCEI|nr:response regulator [Candidatus Eisenbacteria bacterium]